MLRWLPLIALCPTLAFADDVRLSARVTKATIHPQGATLQRQVAFSVPAGQHRLILSDLPDTTPVETVRVSVSGATLGAITLRETALLPRDLPKSPELIAAKADLRRIEDEITALRTRRQQALLPVAAADAITAYLGRLGTPENGAADIETLRRTAQMVGEETLTAQQAALEARTKASALNIEQDKLERAQNKAQQTVEALQRGDTAYIGFAAEIRTDKATKGMLTLEYVINDAYWLPVYDVHLTRGDDPSLRVQRGAYVLQDTGEDWAGVDLFLSTAQPLSQTQPSFLYPDHRSIREPRPPIAFSRRQMAEAEMPMVEPMVMEEAVPVMQLDGISVTYGYPQPVDVASGADKLRLSLGKIDMQADVFARAIPQIDETAYLMASFTNTSGEIILPSDAAFLYLDGQFTGTHPTDLIADGDTAEFSFGAIEGLRLTDTIVSRNEGDRGMLSRSNEKTETRKFDIDNLTGQAWDLRLQGRVPYSEQEDLVILWQARPEPQEKNLNGRRGILEWHLTMKPHSQRTVRLEHSLSWPDGMELR